MAIAPSTTCEIQLFEPPSDAVYTIGGVAQLVDLPPRTILLYCKHRLISPGINAGDRSYSFDSESIRALRRIEALRPICGDDFAGIKIILDLMNELEHLRSEVRSFAHDKSPQTRKSHPDKRRK